MILIKLDWNASSTLSGLLVILASVAQCSYAASCPPQLQRPSDLEQMMKSVVNMDTIFEGMPFAGDVEDPSLMPEVNLSNFRNVQQDHLPPNVDWLYFAFQADKLKTSDPTLISVPSKYMFCLLRPGDTVLLSDRVNHHYTGIARTDTEAGYVYVVDPWADRMFLQGGFQLTGTRSEKSGAFVKIPWEDFRRLIVGIVTPDTMQLANYYFEVNPAAKSDLRVYVAFARTALETQNSQFLEPAIGLLEKGLAISNSTNDKEANLSIASQLHYALLLLYLEGQRLGASSTDQEMLRLKLKLLVDRFGNDVLFDQNSPAEIKRLGDATGNLGSAVASHSGNAEDHFKFAIGYYDAAIRRDPAYEEAIMHRGIAKQQVNGFLESAIQDLSDAIRLNEASRAELMAKMKARSSKRVFNWDQKQDKKTLMVLDNRRARAFEARSQAYLKSEQCGKALRDAEELLRLKPQASSGPFISKACVSAAGRF